MVVVWKEMVESQDIGNRAGDEAFHDAQSAVPGLAAKSQVPSRFVSCGVRMNVPPLTNPQAEPRANGPVLKLSFTRVDTGMPGAVAVVHTELNNRGMNAGET
jgi:hypothetical protein